MPNTLMASCISHAECLKVRLLIRQEELATAIHKTHVVYKNTLRRYKGHDSTLIVHAYGILPYLLAFLPQNRSSIFPLMSKMPSDSLKNSTPSCELATCLRKI